METIKKMLAGFFASQGSVRRLAAFVVGLALPPLNKKLGLDIPSEQVIAGLAFVGAYIGQSLINSMSARKAGVEAAKAVQSVDDAAKVLGEGAKP